MPSHTHGGSFSTVQKVADGTAAKVNDQYATAGDTLMWNSGWRPGSTTATGGGGSHAHSAAISTAVESLPPYYALTYIMKL